VTQLTAIGITTTDIAASCRFYRTLGLDVPEPPPGDDHFGIELPNGMSLMWDTEELVRGFDPEVDLSGSRVSLAFRCADARDVDAVYARLVEAGFRGKKEPWDAFWGQRYALVLDPDDGTVSLFAPL
jgi:catechol 2,3-dioxygenase-like lactoylglutathione lyase family enzyme